MLGYSCRACRKAIQAIEGCAVCKPLKSVIVVTGSDQPSLHDTAFDTVKLLKQQLKDYTEVTKNTKAKPPDVEAARAAIRSVANTMAKLLDSARKLEEGNQAALKNMGPAEQIKMFVAWYRDLPPTERLTITAALATTDDELNVSGTGGWQNINDTPN